MEEIIWAAAIFIGVFGCSYLAAMKILESALKKIDEPEFQDEIQKTITLADYQMNKRDKLLLAVGSMWVALTPLLMPVYPSLIAYLGISTILLISALVDLKIRYSPDILALGLFFFAAVDLFQTSISLSSVLLGALFPGGLFLLICMFIPGFMGGADVKLLIALGTCLGAMQTASLYLASCVVLGIIYLPMYLMDKISKKKRKIWVPAIVGFFIAYLFVQYEPDALLLFDI